MATELGSMGAGVTPGAMWLQTLNTNGFKLCPLEGPEDPGGSQCLITASCRPSSVFTPFLYGGVPQVQSSPP